jgi:hypothetical protein
MSILDKTADGERRPPVQEEAACSMARVITSIEDLRRLAERRVPRMFYDYADSGSWSCASVLLWT